MRKTKLTPELRHSAYLAFQNIRQRCTNRNNKDFDGYGGRGVECALLQEEFAEVVAERDTDEAVIAWLGNRSDKFPSEKDAFNDVLINLCPSTDGQQAYLKSMIARYDSDRTEIESFLAAGVLDDEITFARLKAKV